MTDAAFARAFEAGEIRPEDFDHVAHLRVAWVYVCEAGSADAALPRIRAAIQGFAAAAGAAQKYHETITVVWMRLLENAGAHVAQPCELSELLRQRPELADKNLPLQQYSRARLFSDAARESYVPPDLESGTETSPKSQLPTPN
jgi:hypothetical protein